ncbi:hypothetical protein P7M46_02510 [Bisgaard Taxon 10/6]|uniref:Uncharacterized protein n=1 Tax=Exercitatus varius TaxID=67857 RepID=A0AAW6QFI5_9PAST|nr:hypothetical protein [Exercitatus varius]MDG2916885.1 hypothetical protein [Exercitatus varius]MDG2950974.1 hypothetical protein [Exercitatus varius]MDG2952507.1 hypothetical protein [Exercitatus varius]
MTVYKVTLKTPTGDYTIDCPDDVYILDAADEFSESSIGKGKWAIIDIDRFSLTNAAIWLLQRLSNLEPGKLPGDREFWHTERTVTVEWVRSYDQNYGEYIHSSNEHMYGETRTVHQTYLPELLKDGNFKMRWEPNLLESLD